jgi:hypothetical protein
MCPCLKRSHAHLTRLRQHILSHSSLGAHCIAHFLGNTLHYVARAHVSNDLTHRSLNLLISSPPIYFPPSRTEHAFFFPGRFACTCGKACQRETTQTRARAHTHTHTHTQELVNKPDKLLHKDALQLAQDAAVCFVFPLFFCKCMHIYARDASVFFLLVAIRCMVTMRSCAHTCSCSLYVCMYVRVYVYI